MRRSAAAAGILHSAAFLLTAVLWLCALAIFGFYPFGERSVLITDMGQQYIEYHAALYDTVIGGGSLLYTWNTGLGMNFVGLFSYYLSSPFTLLMFLFPRGSITDAVLFIISMKIAASGLTFSIYLRKTVGIHGIHNILFSVLYALSGYTAVYFFNLMWLDSVVLLPLVILAVRHLVNTGRKMPLTVAFALLFFSNFYTAYMVGVFSLLYLAAMLWLKGQIKGENQKAVRRFFIAAVLAAGLTAFLTLPTAFALIDSQGSLSADWVFLGFMADPLTLLGKMAFGAYDSITDSGTPYIYCGALTLGLIPVWLLHKGIPRREKTAYAALIAVMLISMFFSLLDYLWHAAETPIWFPCRYSFLLIFLLLTCAARAITASEGLTRRKIIVGYGAAAVIMLLSGLPKLIFPKLFDSATRNLPVTLATLTIYGLLTLLIVNPKPLLRRGAAMLLVLLVSAELVGNTVASFNNLDTELGFEYHTQYKEFYHYKSELADAIQKAAERDGLAADVFFRTENTLARNANDGMSVGYHAVSHYSSFSKRDTFNFLGKCGMFCLSDCKIFRYYGATTALDSILGVKYIFSPYERRFGYTDAGISTGGISAGGLSLWRNQTALPLAFYADQDVLMPFGDSATPFKMLNRFMSALTGEQIVCYTPLEVNTDYEHCEVKYDGSRYRLKTSETGVLSFKINNPIRQNVLFYLDSNLSEFTHVYLNGTRINEQGERLIRGVIELGELEAGEVVVSLAFSGDKHWFTHASAAAFDTKKFGAVANKLNKGSPTSLMVSRNKFGEPIITGTLHAPQNGVIFTSVPADRSWKAEIDGKSVKPETVYKAFIALPISQGHHTFTLRYRPRGLVGGVIISGISIVLCAVLAVRRKCNPATSNSPPTAESPFCNSFEIPT